MWMFTRYGFFSVSALDKNRFLIRARNKKHLECLKRNFVLLKNYPILHEIRRDYVHRMVVPREVWSTVVLKMNAEQTWKNIKDECKRFQADPLYNEALHNVWETMYMAGEEWDGRFKREKKEG